MDTNEKDYLETNFIVYAVFKDGEKMGISANEIQEMPHSNFLLVTENVGTRFYLPINNIDQIIICKDKTIKISKENNK